MSQTREMSENEWNQLAWHGISFVKPRVWELGKVEGDEQKGSLRLDDHISSRMELSWQKQPRPSLEKVLEKCVKGLKRKASRQKIDLKIMNMTDYHSGTIKGKYFFWEANSRRVSPVRSARGHPPESKISNGVNLIGQCKKSSRLILASIFGKEGEHIEKKAEKIFGSLKDHRGGSKLQWSVFDFVFTTPAELRLDSYSFLSGHLRLNFTRGEDSFIFQRLSVADILLKRKTLSQWVIKFCRAQFSKVDIEVSYPQEEGRDEAMYAVGREQGKIRFIKKRFFRSLMWYCQKTNHIFGVTEFVRKKENSRLDKLASGVTCH